MQNASTTVERPAFTFFGTAGVICGATTGEKITPPEWAPWGLLGAGMVVIIYSFTIPRRVKG